MHNNALNNYARLSQIAEEGGVAIPHDTLMKMSTAADLPPGMGAFLPVRAPMQPNYLHAMPPAPFYGAPPAPYYGTQAPFPQFPQFPQFNHRPCNIEPQSCAGQVNGVQYLGFGPQSVVGGAQANVSQQPQRSIQPKYLTIPGSIASYFSILDLKVGNISQLNAGGAVPAENFVENATYREWLMTPAMIGNLVTISVLNNDVAVHPFTASLSGPACDMNGATQPR